MKKIIQRILPITCLWLASLQVSNAQPTGGCSGSVDLKLSTGLNTSGTNLPISTTSTPVIDPYWRLVNVPPLASNYETGYAIPNAYTIPTGTASGISSSWVNIPGTVGLSVIPQALFSDVNLYYTQPWRFIRKFNVLSSGMVRFYGSVVGDNNTKLSLYDAGGTHYFSHICTHWAFPKAINDSIYLNEGCYYLEVELLNETATAMGFAVNLLAVANGANLANPNNNCCATAIITGQKYIDKDCDGKVSSTDVPGANWDFNLMSGSTIVQSATTDVNGDFIFYGVPYGTYTLQEVNQAGYYPGNPTSGSYTVTVDSNNTAVSYTFLNCQDTIPPGNCAQVINPKIICDSGQYKLQFTVKNLASWDIKGITINNLNPNVQAVSTVLNGGDPFYDITDIYAGATSGVITVPIYVTNYDSNACFNFTFCDFDVPGTTHLHCCTIDSICADVVYCPGTGGTNCTNPCDGLTDIEWQYVDSVAKDCCFKLSFKNDYIAANIGKIILEGIGGTEFSVTNTNGWTYGGINTATHREFIAPVGGYGRGYYADFVQLCITDTTPAPHQVLVQYIDVNGICMCLDTLTFDACTVVPPSCATIINDSIYCEHNKTIFSFYIRNDAPYPIRQMDYFISDTAHFVMTPNQIQFSAQDSIRMGAIAGPFTVEIDTINGGAAQFCFQVSAFNNAYTQNSYATQCCSDAMRQICLPFLDCKIGGCCEFDKMIIPNGITPNGDGFNDTWVLTVPAMCDSISITVFNRWGNEVYKDLNYANNWGGTNQNGALLPQSTYFVVIELKNGSKKGMYIDVRY